MPGPFPGMDPYLENHWGDVHTRLIVGISDQLQEQLPRGLRARIEEHVAVEIEDERRARVRPDVRVVERVPVGSGRSAAALAEDAADELIVELDAEAATERTVYIIDLSTGGRVITSIEVLSPGNKETVEDRERFQAKQRELLRGGVSLVEIDLIRQGGWTVSVPQRELPLAYGYPYRLVVRRGNEPTRAICRKAPLQERLPVIRIPLRASDQDVTLDLQQVVDDAWRKGGYDDLDYANEPMPPFSEADAAWVRERIRTV
jgi:hypothetical protein